MRRITCCHPLQQADPYAACLLSAPRLRELRLFSQACYAITAVEEAQTAGGVVAAQATGDKATARQLLAANTKQVRSLVAGYLQANGLSWLVSTFPSHSIQNARQLVSRNYSDAVMVQVPGNAGKRPCSFLQTARAAHQSNDLALLPTCRGARPSPSTSARTR